jgi:carboxylesterase type B
MRVSISIGVWLVAGLATSSKLGNDDAPRVKSSSGTIIGHRARHRPETFEFLGIKYGKAPVGELRFAAPERYVAPPGSVYDASTWIGYTSSQTRR